MSATGLAVFDETVQKTNAWLKDIAESLSSDRHHAYQALRAALHALRDRLTIEETAQLGAQLPMLVRGIYYESWRPTGKPERIRSLEDSLARIAAELPDTRLEPELTVKAVLQVLANHITRGEKDDIISSLPRDIGALWPTLPEDGKDAAVAPKFARSL